jgi:hypothetical protein
MSQKASGLETGRVYNFKITLEGDVRKAFEALAFADQLRLADLGEEARAAAVADLVAATAKKKTTETPAKESK